MSDFTFSNNLIFIISGVTGIIIIIVFYIIFKAQTKVKAPAEAEHVPVQRTAARRAVGNRNRIRGGANAGQRESTQIQETEIDQNDDEAAVVSIDLNDPKLGAKKRAKLEAKAEKKAHREAESKLREQRKIQQEKEDAEKKLKEEKERAIEAKQEEEKRKAEEEKKRKEEDAYQKMKAAFTVEEEGFDEEGADEQGNLLQEFITHIKEQKVVMLEDIAARFRLKIQTVVNRLEELLASGTLTGVIDDRGKFIYITPEELKAVADFMKKRGRVSIQELVENSNNLISLK